MTTDEKTRVDELRAAGQGYKKIARELGLSENTVKSYIRRSTEPVMPDDMVCPECGKRSSIRRDTGSGSSARRIAGVSTGRSTRRRSTDGAAYRSGAGIVERFSRTTSGAAGSIAAMRATSLIGIKAVMAMTKEQFRAEKRFQTVMATARRMLREGLITEDEYRRFEKKMAQKYTPTFGTLFSELT